MHDDSPEERLRDKIESVAGEIDDEDLLSLASPEAREEWAALRTRCRDNGSDQGPHEVHGEDHLSIVLTKVRRFRDVLHHLKETRKKPSESWGLDGAGEGT